MLFNALRAIGLLTLLSIVLVSTSRAQPANNPDRVYYLDKKDGIVKDLEASLKASPTGYQIVSSNDKKVVATVSAAEIIRVVPGDIPKFDRKQIMEPVGFEIKKEWEKARLGHAEMLKESSGAPEKVRKYLEFRQAICAAHAADETPDEAAAVAKTDEAVKLLENYLTAYKTGWEVWTAGQTCARLQVTSTESKDGDKGNGGRRLFEEAARTWGKVARAADLAPDLKLDAALQEIDNKIRARLFADARGLIDEALKTAPAGAAKDRLAIFQLAVKFGDGATPLAGVKPIEDIIEKSKDPSVRATAYGMLGELYLAADKNREAMWKFFWVEVVYNQDRDEVVKAEARLADAFRLQGDEDHARTFREKARRLRGGS